MPRTPFACLVAGLTMAWMAASVGRAQPGAPAAEPVNRAIAPTGMPTGTTGAAQQATPAEPTLVREFCVTCHNDMAMRGNLSLVGFDADHPEQNAELIN
jgi:hypothetical protein